MKDFNEIGIALDETVDSAAFKKYSKQPRPLYKKSFENQNLLVFVSHSFIVVAILMSLIEYSIHKLSN